MPDKKNKAQFRQIVQDWFAGHDTSIPDLPNVREFGTPPVKFAVIHKFTDTRSHYQNALGYFLDHNNTRHRFCRHFYKSHSESFWRIGTGFRANLAWVKGAEGHPLNMPGGYIFEGMLHRDFHALLEQMADTIILTEKGCGLVNAVQELNEPALSSYLIRRAGRGAFSGIIDSYAQERRKTDVLTALPTALSHDLLKKDQPFFQKSVQPKIKGHPSRDNPDNIADQLKEDTALWQEINTCLNARIADGEYTFKHDLLNKNCRVVSYSLRNAVIEIARTVDFLDLEYESVSKVKYNMHTPVCWVKSVYMGTEVSTFGNYKTYPEDLCFMVQKPLDYIDQARVKEDGLADTDDRTEENYEIIKRMGVKGALVNQGTRDERFQVAPDYKGENIQDNYIRLHLYNEKYSPLLIKFKQQQKFPLFKWTSQKFINTNIVSFENVFKAYKSGPRLGDLLDAIKRSCGEYISDRNRQHGTRGIRRVADFAGYIAELYTYTEINQAVYELFCHNRVNGRSCGFLNRIRTTETSFFTIFCRYVLSALFELAPFAFAYNDSQHKGFRKIIDDAYHEKTNLANPNDAIGRLALKAIMKAAYENPDVYTKKGEKIREELLGAVNEYRKV